MSNIMKRTFKKLGALLMSLCMVMAMGVTAFAADTASTDVGTITIKGLETSGKVSVQAYQIVKGIYDEDGNFLGYEQTVTGGEFTIDKYGQYDEEKLTEANLAALFANITGSAYATVDADSDGTATFQNMAIGSYLFTVTGSEGTIYGMVIGSVSYANADGEWTINNGEIDVIEGTSNWLKASEPMVEKTEVGGSLDSEHEGHGGSADVGDELTYHITINNIPSYEGQYPVFNVADHLQSDISLSAEQLAGIKVTVNGTTELTAGTDYTVEATDDGFIVDFVVNGKYTLNNYAGADSVIIIEFNATIASADVSDDDTDHTNRVDLDYATNSFVMNSDIQKEDIDHDYTFNAKIQKVDGDKSPLADAVFALYTDADCTTAYTQNGSEITATSGTDGYFEFTGLQEGTYYMKETTAPAGYALNQEVYTITIRASYNEDGTMQGFTIIVTDSTGESVGNAVVSTTSAQITNNKVGALPSMGGMGTMLFTILGAVIILGACAGVVIYRRKRA